MSDPAKPSGERREHSRAVVSTKAIVLVRHNAGVAAHIEDLSRGGVRLTAEITVEAGERVQILFEIDGHPFEVTGEVLRAQVFDMTTDELAVQFVDLDDETARHLDRLVERLIEAAARDLTE